MVIAFCYKGKLFIVLTAILLAVTSLFAQNLHSVDSLLKIVTFDKNLLKKYQAFITLGGEYVFTNADSSIIYDKAALSVAKELKNDSLIANAYYAIASIEATRNNYEPALHYCDSAFTFFKKTNNIYALAMVRNVQGGVYMASGKNEQASLMFFDAVDYTKSDTESNRILFTYHNLVILFNGMDKHEKALEYAFKQYQWAKRINIPEEIGYACSNIVDTYLALKDSAKTITYINEFLNTTKNTQDLYLQVVGKNQLGILSTIKKNYQQAASFFLQSLKLNNNLVDQQLGCICLLNLGKTYQKMKLYEKADSCFLKAIDITYQLNIKVERKEAYEMLMQDAAATSRFNKAFIYAGLLQCLKDSLLNEKSENALADAETRYKLDEKNKELELIQAEQKLRVSDLSRQRTQKFIFLFATLTVLVISLLIFNRYKLKKRIEQQELILKERTRISQELHDDLGGGLSTIRLMTEMVKDPQFGLNGNYLENISAKSKELIQSMNEIVWSLNTNNDNLKGTIAYVRQYAGSFLQDAKIDVEFDLPNEIKDLEVDGEVRRHIFLLVKEALHNVVKHAAATKTKITITCDDHLLKIQICDNGKGFHKAPEDLKYGNGLTNMKKRVDALHGDIKIENQFGTSILFTIPVSSLYNKSVRNIL